MQTFIFGHRNPDTDSVCSSIALSYLLNEMGRDTVPKVLGHLNLETKFVIDYFKVKAPDYLNDTKVQIKDILYNKKANINEEESIDKTFKKMQEEGITAIPITDKNHLLKGFVTLKEIAKYLINGDKENIHTSYDNIKEAVEGREFLKFDSDIDGKSIVAAYQSKTFLETITLGSNDIVIVGDRYKILEYAINSKVKLIVMTGDLEVPEELVEIAKKNKINIIISKFNSFDTASKVILSNRIRSINLNEKPVTINAKDYRTDFLAMASKIGHTNYPVVDNKNNCLGMLKVTSADNYQKQKVILVDHNGLSQSAIGIEEAEIIEIIDHHNLSAIGTNVPINFRSMPVGCTATIIFDMYKERKVDIPVHIAGLMLSAILSDTMIFKSPTTTEMDKKAAEELAKIAGVEIDSYGYEMFKAASSIKGISVNDLINQDFKAYSIGSSQLGISQVMTMDFNEIESNIEEYINKLDELKNNSYMAVVLFITDVYKNGSYVIYNREAKDIVQDAFDLSDVYEGVYIADLVSRKKQMLPALLEVIEKRV